MKESKNGIGYEVVLEKPSGDVAPPPSLTNSTISPSRVLSHEDIENKLKAAEERRKSMELMKLNQLKEKESHMNEVRDKKNEYNKEFMENSRESLEKKMETSKELRETYIKSILDKSTEHVRLPDNSNCVKFS